jgi:8-oxo-dGTP pyrophosphatase MutT (NUDIX family)
MLATVPNAGIPVGFRKKTYDDVSGTENGHAASIMFVAPDGDVLLCRRSLSEENYGGFWALPGGKAEDGEAIEDAIRREVREELGGEIPDGKLNLLDQRITPNGLAHRTFAMPVTEKFSPKINGEHVGWSWTPLHELPEKLHPGVAATIRERVLAAPAADMTPEEWSDLREGFLKWMREEESEAEHAGDEEAPTIEVDDDHDGPWMSCMSRDGSRMYRNRNVPSSIEIAGKVVKVDDVLLRHEVPEFAEISRLLVAFEQEEEREPDEDERIAIYGTAHRTQGEPSERAYLEEMGIDRKAWNAWCRGIESKIERGPFENEPADADVHPAPHRHGELEEAIDALAAADETAKISHEEAGYVFPAPGPDYCRSCSMFEPKGLFSVEPGRCSLVRDVIEPAGWCEHYEWIGVQAADELLAGDSFLAFDRSIRSFDKDGRLRLERVNISKANICPYRGEEIPGWQELKLDPVKIYHLYRDPDELAKSAESSNGVQLLQKHIPVNADDAQQFDVVGATGTDGLFENPYLSNSLFVWTTPAIEGIESGAKKQLSMGYHYRADMTPGKIGDTSFDGVMRDIVVNHVALVETGRAGPDIVVGDSMEGLMAEKNPTRIAALALRYTARAINPILALDAKVPLLPIFKDLTSKNFDAKKIHRAVVNACKGKTIAKDNNMEHVGTMLDNLFEIARSDKSADESVSGPQHRAMMAAAEGHSNLGIPQSTGEEYKEADKGKSFTDALPEFLRGKGMSEDDINHVMGMMPKPATDSEKDAEGLIKKEEEVAQSEDEEDDEKEEKKEEMVTKDELDATMKAALEAQAKQIRGEQRDLRLALDEVRPYVGELAPTLGFDTGEQVRRHALKALGVEGYDTIHLSALSTVLKMQPKAGAKVPEKKIGMDATSADQKKSFLDRFPDAARIGQV